MFPLLQAVATLVPFVAFCIILRLNARVRVTPRLRSVAVIVLGDIGRSPRIMYHAQSFAHNNFETHIVGYQGSRETSSLLTLPCVHFVYLLPPPAFIAKLPRYLFLFFAPLKVLLQIATLLSALFFRLERAPEFILVQNPPSIPTLGIVCLAARVRGSKVIIDWHNLGYSILALKLGDKHILVNLAKWFEKTFGRSAYLHLFVTKAMKDHLSTEWDLQGRKIVFHDRPPTHFRPSSPAEVHDLFLRLAPAFTSTLSTFLPPYNAPSSTPFTALAFASQDSRSSSPAASSSLLSPLPTLRPDRPALLVSSTSWTEDEDFSILLTALSLYEEQARIRAKSNAPLPKLLVIVTGKGPLRELYMQKTRELEMAENWEWTRCRSLWLEPEDYPLFLGSADLGVSLHSSSSALDLPMKVVDMFGSGLPVLALDFQCLDELVLDGKNGLVFHTADELAGHLIHVLESFPTSSRLSVLRTFFSRNPEWDWCSWDENWDRVLRPIVLPNGTVDTATLKMSTVSEDNMIL